MCTPTEITCFPEMWELRVTFLDGRRFSEYGNDEVTKRSFDDLLAWFCDPPRELNSAQDRVGQITYANGRGAHAFARVAIASIEIHIGSATIYEER